VKVRRRVAGIPGVSDKPQQVARLNDAAYFY
jgi:hypothetical protein